MMRSLYSGITGLKNHQTRMDVIGNNISNVNTAGYKASRVVFQDIYSQTLSPASANATTVGGTNPKQVGLGSSLASIDVLHTASASQYTGVPLDLAIEGSGFFVIRNNGQEFYTRAGNFGTDNSNYLVNGNGAYVLGYMGDTTPVPGADPDLIQIPSYFKDVSVDKDGQITGIDGRETVPDPANPTGPEIPNDDYNKNVTIGYIAIATFNNENALEKVGQNAYRATTNSGEAAYNTPGKGVAGKLNPGTLEMSNVDLASEFTDMIVTQRGFQANSRIITTTDTMLEELVNLKR
ncbi:MAG TPA: flagellar hook-basal body complex protein [Feifaniaceae bacterium]|nr:flagellar hook-basal body complex protein [Feifaniaceae bacterium]